MSTGTVEGVGFLIANIYSVYWLSSGFKKKGGGGGSKANFEQRRNASNYLPLAEWLPCSLEAVFISCKNQLISSIAHTANQQHN